MEYLFEGLGDLAQQIESMASAERQKAKQAPGKQAAIAAAAAAFAYEQAAHMVRNSRFVDIAA
jgi:hypothetical protein